MFASVSEESPPTVPFAALELSAPRLRALDRAFGALESIVELPAERAPAEMRRWEGPNDRTIRLELDPAYPVLRLVESGEASGSWLRVWRAPGAWLDPVDRRYLQRAGLRPICDGVCLPRKQSPPRRWRDVSNDDLAALVVGVRWSVRRLRAEVREAA